MASVHFAWRCWQIVPDGLAQYQSWEDHNMLDQPRPPKKWLRQGFARPWHSWRDARKLPNNQVIAREAFSIAWCQRTQQYWVVLGDCTDRSEPACSERHHNWKTLFCRHLKESDGKPGLWELLDHGIARQHDSQCPEDFDEFLPKNFFMGIVPEEACHFVGHLSLILGLLAMCPRELRKIPRQIDEKFYHNNEPRFMPWDEYTRDGSMDRFTHPGRAIVMQTGIIKDDATSEEWLRAWERGDFGPMVSSQNPTQAQKLAWGIPLFEN